MTNINITVLLCQNYDEKERTIERFYNQIETNNKDIELCILTVINTVGGPKNLDLDYYLKCVDSPDQTETVAGKKIPLFSVGMKDDNKSTTEKEYLVNETIFSQKQKLTLPNKGIYDIQVFLMDDETSKIEDADDRYKYYQKKNIAPQSAFRFIVK